MGPRRILVVDDEPQLVGLITRYLQRLGYEVRSTADTAEAWRLFEAGPGTFALAILDLTMPGVSGEQLARHALESDPELRVLLSSGYATDLRALRTEYPGRVGFLQKPFSADMLAEHVRRMLPNG